jgi:hypothetical protein
VPRAFLKSPVPDDGKDHGIGEVAEPKQPWVLNVVNSPVLEDSSDAGKIDDRSTGRPRPSVSARLKALPRELECVVQLAWRCVSNPFKLHAGMEFIRTVTSGQLLGNVLQRRCIRQINQSSKVAIGLLPRLSPEPKSSEQHRSVFNEVVGGVHNEVVGGV